MASIIDLRSDTVTVPSEEMRSAMATARVGDDVYGEDPTVIELQNKMAALLNKEASLFFPSGTMSNLTGVMCHANERGDEILLGDRSHIAIWEQGNVSSLGGVYTRHVRNLPNGTLDLDELRTKLYFGHHDAHYTTSKAIVIENTHNYYGGCPIDTNHMDQIHAIAKTNNLKVHVDGARLFNAATSLGVQASELVKHADTVSVCLSKGLGAPVGSLLVGTSEVIKRAHKIRKSLGGGMRQVGVLAAAGLVAMTTIPLLAADHDKAKRLGAGLASMTHLGINIDTSNIHTNILLFSLQRRDLHVSKFLQLIETPTRSNEVIVKMSEVRSNVVRAVLHKQVSDDDVNNAMDKIRSVLNEKY